MVRYFDKFLLLVWKNYTLQRRHPVRTVLEILLPVLFVSLIVLQRSLIKPVHHSDKVFHPFQAFDIQFNLSEKLRRIAWSPSNTELNKVMDIAVKKFGIGMRHVSLKSSQALMVYLNDEDNIDYTLAGVLFDDSLSEMTKNTFPRNIHIDFRFPAKSRSNLSQIATNTWLTNLIFNFEQEVGPRSPDHNDGAEPSYSQEGFLLIQQAVSFGLVEYLTNKPVPNVIMQRFPYPSWTEDPLIKVLNMILGYIVIFAFLCSVVNITQAITTEKEKQLKEAMKIMGLPGWLHWTAWFIKTVSFLLISIILITLLVTVSWSPNTKYKVFTLADPWIIFVFFMMYMVSIVTYCFAVSVFFSKANMAAIIGTILFYFQFDIYGQLHSVENLSLTLKLLGSLILNVAFGYGLEVIIMFEANGEGVQWHNIWKTGSPSDNLTLGHIIIMLLVDTVLYFLIAIYVEAVFPGDYGVPQVWYFPFTCNYWCTGKIDPIDNDEPPLVGRDYEREPNKLLAGIKIKHLRKEFRKKVAVRDLSLNLYEDQITVLLGHNGAGKTTTMSMLTGMITPTSGTAIIGGYDIRKNMNGVRKSLGLCPQHNILFDELTVREHLYFYSKLKGLRGKAVNKEINKYIELLELQPKANAKSSALSGGMKRQLSVGIALCGDSKVIMCDEPSSGMDPSARRALWDLLASQKKGRTILLTTHYMDEADLLGDRIAILAGGHLQCCGSSFFLKKRYGAGYHLIMEKAKNCNVNSVTDLLKKYIPNIEVESNIGSQLSYVLTEAHASVFETMLNDLESQSSSLGVRSFGISLTTLEEVFMKVGADHGQEEINNQREADGEFSQQQRDTSSGVEAEYGQNDTRLDVGHHQFLTGFSLWSNQFSAMIKKKILALLRSWRLVLVHFIIPVILNIPFFLGTFAKSNNTGLPKLEITLDSYDTPITVIGGDDNPYKNTYINYLAQNKYLHIDWKKENVTEHMLKQTKTDTSEVRNRYIVGATFDDAKNEITAWFNNEPLHSPPLALQLVINSILRTAANDSSYDIKISNNPLPHRFKSGEPMVKELDNGGIMMAIGISFSMAFVCSFFIMFCIRERVTKAKHLQCLSGVRVLPFWFASFVIDLLAYTIASLLLVIAIVSFQVEHFSTFSAASRIFFALLCCGFSAIPLMYLASYLFNTPVVGYIVMIILSFSVGTLGFMIISLLLGTAAKASEVIKYIHWVLLVMPHYALSSSVNQLYLISQTSKICHHSVDLCKREWPSGTNCYNLICKMQPNCCGDLEPFFAWEDPGIGRNIVFSLSLGSIFFFVTILIDYGVFKSVQYQIESITISKAPKQREEDDDVQEEKHKINQASRPELNQYCVALRKVSKYYGKFLALNDISLGINPGECFGLLGINGAGKTTTFKIMTGDITLSYGDVWINGINLKEDIKKVYKCIGYCPQFDALLDDFTGRETLKMFGSLRGIPSSETNALAEKFAHVFDFTRHLDKQIKEYSGGNKRKLSAAVAFVGDPQAVFLDEPTAGLDPGTRWHLLNALCQARDNGTCIVLTTQSMEECEALCTRLAIMVNGRLLCLGSVQHLKNKFAYGYTLTIKLKSSEDDQSTVDYKPIETFITKNFSSAIERERRQELLTYYITDKNISWSKMFGIMERGKKALNLEDYSLCQSSLEQVFLKFTKLQTEQ